MSNQILGTSIHLGGLSFPAMVARKCELKLTWDPRACYSVVRTHARTHTQRFEDF